MNILKKYKRIQIKKYSLFVLLFYFFKYEHVKIKYIHISYTKHITVIQLGSIVVGRVVANQITNLIKKD